MGYQREYGGIDGMDGIVDTYKGSKIKVAVGGALQHFLLFDPHAIVHGLEVLRFLVLLPLLLSDLLYLICVQRIFADYLRPFFDYGWVWV